MKTIEEIDKEFTEYLWKLPQHWFAEYNNGIRVMDPISYALYQAFCQHYDYEFGKFDLVSEEERKITTYVTKNPSKERSDENRKLITYTPKWGNCEGDYKILLPIFKREKQKYLELMQFKQLLKKGKPIFGMIHLSFDEADDDRIKRAIRETQILEEEGVDGIIVENYHGSVDDIEKYFEQSKAILENSKLIVGINVLPNDYKEALELADKVGAKFIQLDYVAGTYLNNKFIYESHFLSIREKYPHILVLGGVWPKYYEPVETSKLKDDIKSGMKRADAIVVTGAGTGKETPLDKIKEFKDIVGDFPLIIGAGLTPDNISVQLALANGGIVGSSFKPGEITRKEIKRELVKSFMDEVRVLKNKL